MYISPNKKEIYICGEKNKNDRYFVYRHENYIMENPIHILN